MSQSSRARAWAEPLAFIATVSALLLVVFPRGFTNYDTIYYLLWGKEIAQGMSPDYGAPLAPTPTRSMTCSARSSTRSATAQSRSR